VKLSVPASVQEIDLSQVDLLDASLYATGELHAVLRHLRKHQPVYRQDTPGHQPFWNVTRYDDVLRVLKSYAEFTSRRGTLICIVDLNVADFASDMMMPDTDPPLHTRMREPLARALTARAIQAQTPRLRQLAIDLLAPGLAGAPYDLAAATRVFPIQVMGTLFGLPADTWERLAQLVTMTVAYRDPEFAEGSPQATLRQAHHELFACFAGELRRRRRRADSGHDLIGVLMRMQLAGSYLSDEEILCNLYSLLLGGGATTPQVINATILELAERPDEYRRWASRPDLLESGVEEALRWSSPATHFMRHAVADIELRGQTIRAGDSVTAWIASANRDEQIFPDPFRFDVGRTPNRHLAFGIGPHYCIGAPLARVALTTFFSELLRRVEQIEVPGPIEHLESNQVAGIKHMTVHLVPRARPAVPDEGSAHAAHLA
jgi:cytochrome P450